MRNDRQVFFSGNFDYAGKANASAVRRSPARQQGNGVLFLLSAIAAAFFAISFIHAIDPGEPALGHRKGVAITWPSSN